MGALKAQTVNQDLVDVVDQLLAVPSPVSSNDLSFLSIFAEIVRCPFFLLGDFVEKENGGDGNESVSMSVSASGCKVAVAGVGAAAATGAVGVVVAVVVTVEEQWKFCCSEWALSAPSVDEIRKRLMNGLLQETKQFCLPA